MSVTEQLNDAKGRPSWYGTCGAYLRSFMHNRHAQTSDLMPCDKKITLACRRMYQTATDEERAVMNGKDFPGLNQRRRTRIFNTLIFRLAKLSGMAAFVIEPDYNAEEPKNINTKGDIDYEQDTEST